VKRQATISFGVESRQCAPHAWFGLLPCPWPECEQGIDADELVDTLQFLGHEPRTAQRLTWTLADGSPTYSWKRDPEMPVLLDVPELTRREIRRTVGAPVTRRL